MKLKRPSLPYLIWMAVFMLIPMVMILFYAFTDANNHFSFETFNHAFFSSDMETIPIFLRSLWIAFLSTAICLVLAYPIAYIFSRQKKSVQNLLTMIIMIPMWMNFILRIYAWITLLENGGPIDTMLSFLGIHLTLLNNRGAVILGMVYEYLPFMVLPLYTVMTKIDYGLIEAADDLGANKLNVLRKVVLPLTVPGIVSGVTMVFVPSASTFLVSTYLGGINDTMIGDLIEQIFQSDRHMGSAIALVLMIAILIFLIVLNLFGDEEAIS